ncbi:oxidoreductase, partial [Mycobacterium tuberculosis]
MDDTGAAPVVIFGGRSQIGGELARRLAAGATMVLAARNADQLADQAAALRAAGAIAVHTREFDADTLAAQCPLGASPGSGPGPIRPCGLA